MLYLIFGFFGASIGAAMGLAVGIVSPQWFEWWANLPTELRPFLFLGFIFPGLPDGAFLGFLTSIAAAFYVEKTKEF